MAEERVQRRLAAIMAADVVGYSRLMGEDEAGTRARFNDHLHELIEPLVASRGGRIVKTMGDGLLVEFVSVVDAVQCAVEIQNSMAERNADEPDDRRIEFRIGVNLGDLIIEGDDIHGDGVNIAARLEGLAEPGGLCVSGKVVEEVRNKLDVSFEDMGAQEVKNIAEPVHVFRFRLDQEPMTSSQEAPAKPPTLPDKPSIAVLPFENMSGDPEQEYFADGIAEDIITTLSHTHWLFVVARNSSFTYKGSAVDVKRVSEELGVGYILEGSVRKAGNRVRITAQLIDAATGNHIWAERFDRDLEDIFAVQDEITESVVAAIGPELMVAETRRAQRKPPQSLDAWDYVLRALSHIWRQSEEDYGVAKDLLLRAVEIDPGYAQAHSMLGWLYIHHAWMLGDKPEETFLLALEAARTAVALDEHDPWARVVLGRVHAYDRDHENAVAELEKAIQLNPNLPIARGMLGLTLAYGGKSEQAIAELDRAIRANPRDPFNSFYHGSYSVACYLAGRYEEAAQWARQGVQEKPNNPGYHRMVAISCAKLGQFEEARAALDRTKRLQPGLSLAWAEAYAPYSRPEDLEHYIDGLREAGLTE